MSKLLENVLKNCHKEALKEFDMSKSSKTMLRYLGNNYPYENGIDVPIEPEKSSWDQYQGDGVVFLQKIYDLQDIKFLLYFVTELIHLAEELFHHPEILISHTQVTIKLYTRDLNDVTDRDLEMSKKIDEIIEDINVIKFR